jgi:hypothetical protein
MDRVAILCDKDRTMMREFSRRSLERVKNSSLLSAALSFFPSYLEGNVRKEVDKDRIIITEAAAAFAAGRPACDLDLEEIFEKTKTVDKAFLDSLTVLSFSVSVRYSDFADVRIQRIWRISRTVYALLEKWPEEGSFPDAVRTTYTGKEFNQVIVDILHLYSRETRMLSDSLRSPFQKAIREYAESLFHAMKDSMEELADSYTKKIYDREAMPCPSQI